ncbi:uncharacterized protein LOC108667669 [Hyalella azteca]|uniref:Uncharacterized protein LOC108667669 n=1 Tax=Hyalella azteca TaxID=294128 RepID=A0A8B7N8G7_HYAAZ|nr:uncharacterized protein LOC108667669 [Hyalella azteca]
MDLSCVWPLALLLLCSATVGSCADACTATCTGHSPGTFVSDPTDCHKYYGCQENGELTDVAFTCPDGYYFSTSYGKCVVESSPCKSVCPLPRCSLTCHVDFKVLVYPGDCTKFQVCTPDGGLSTGVCQIDKPYFDGRECQSNPDHCCDPCTPKCNYPGTQIVDPYNCTNYYFCEDYYNYEANSCRKGMHFDPVTEKCVDGEQCKNVCPINPPTTTTEETTTPEPTTTTPYWWETTTPYWWPTTTPYWWTTPFGELESEKDGNKHVAPAQVSRSRHGKAMEKPQQ